MALPKRPSLGSSDNDSGAAYRSLPTPNIPLPAVPAPTFDDEYVYSDEENSDDYDNGNAGEYDEDEEEYEPARSVFEDEENDESDEIEQELSALSDDIQYSVELLIREILSDESSEVIMNGPNSIHCKRSGRREHLTEIDFKDIETYHHVINKFVLEFSDTKKRISDHAFIVEGQMEIEDQEHPDLPPMVARLHIIAPPVVRSAKVTIAKKARRQFTLEDIYERNAMTANMYEFMKAVARGKITTVISGGTGAGKTTLMEAMSYHFDQDDRVVVAEDTPELKFPLPDVVYMVSSKPDPGDAKDKHAVTLEWLVAAANRMRADRIIVGETRGSEMSEFLIAANSGADGSMTTLHADDPEAALRKISLLASKANNGRSESSLARDIAGTIQLIIQMKLIDGMHIITHITEVSNIVSLQTGKVSLTPIFEYDQRARTWKNMGRPSEGLKAFLESRNVPIQMSWFQK